jgi:hypothetical protein
MFQVHGLGSLLEWYRHLHPECMPEPFDTLEAAEKFINSCLSAYGHKPIGFTLNEPHRVWDNEWYFDVVIKEVTNV